MDENEKKAFNLLTICAFILARTPMVLGYEPQNNLLSQVTAQARSLSTKLSDLNDVTNSKAWTLIEIILDLDKKGK